MSGYRGHEITFYSFEAGGQKWVVTDAGSYGIDKMSVIEFAPMGQPMSGWDELAMTAIYEPYCVEYDPDAKEFLENDRLSRDFGERIHDAVLKFFRENGLPPDATV